MPALARAVQDESEGSLETLTKEGTPVYTAFSRSALSGWTVAAGAPMTLVTTDLYRSIAWIALGTLAAFGLGLWLALKLASRLTSAVQGLVGPALALALGEGRPVEVPRTHVKEAVEVGTALQQASRMLAHAQHLAHYDPLTGLCNRVLFGELVLRELAVAQRSGASFAILAIDLDGFKAVNDMHGHAAGDTVLKEAADRMANAIRVSDVAARLGGDEFAILLLAGTGKAPRPWPRRWWKACRCPMPTSRSRCRPVWASPSTRNRARPCCSCSSAPMWPCTRPRGWASAGSHPTCERSGGRLAGAVNWLNCPALASRLFGELAVMSGAQQEVAVEISHWNCKQPQCRHLVRPCGGGAVGTVVGLIRGVSENFGPIGERR